MSEYTRVLERMIESLAAYCELATEIINFLEDEKVAEAYQRALQLRNQLNGEIAGRRGYLAWFCQDAGEE